MNRFTFCLSFAHQLEKKTKEKEKKNIREKDQEGERRKPREGNRLRGKARQRQHAWLPLQQQR